LAKTIKGPFKITKVNDKITTLIWSKYSKNDNLVNTNLFVKYNRPNDNIETQEHKEVKYADNSEPRNDADHKRQYEKECLNQEQMAGQ
jgi:hypothetical protein